MIHVTTHAIQRFQERVSPVSIEEAHAVLSAPVIERAAEFGARYVRIGTGQRIVIVDGSVVTVLEKGHRVHCMSTEADHRRNLREGRMGEISS